MSLEVTPTNKGGAPLGNQNGAKGKRWREAIQRALARSTGTVDGGLDKAADRLVLLALEGDKWALDHIADRIDGKPRQAVVGDDEADPLRVIHKVERVIVRAKPQDTDG